MTPVNVRFTPDAIALARIQAAFSKVRPRQPMALVIALSVIFVVQGLLNLSSGRALTHLLAYVQLLVGLGYVPLNRSAQIGTLLQATPFTESNVTVDDAGITLAHPAMHVPWKRITGIRDVGEAFVAERTYGKAIPILKRALPDNGSALWASLDAKLTATRYLVRGTSSRFTISNSAARR